MIARGRLLASLLFALTGLGVASHAEAKASHESPYTYKQTFGTALRLLKVDLEIEVSESNAEWGYLLFVYRSAESGKRNNRGSFSFVRQEGKVQVALDIPQMPGYHEQLIMQQLKRKLAQEHGEPPKRPKKSPRRTPKKRKDDAEGKDEPKEGGDDKSDGRRG